MELTLQSWLQAKRLPSCFFFKPESGAFISNSAAAQAAKFALSVYGRKTAVALGYQEAPLGGVKHFYPKL